MLAQEKFLQEAFKEGLIPYQEELNVLDDK
jgi:hypothetical protein